MEVNSQFDRIVRDIYLQQLKDYEKTFDDMTPGERKGLRKWVRDGNSVYENPCLIWSEDGRPMDYINAIRFDEDISNGLAQPTSYPPSDTEDEIPF